LVQEVDTRPAGTETCDYHYGANTASYTVSGEQGYTATYSLDARGYPESVLISGKPASASANWPTRYSYEYDGCRMVTRYAYNADGALNDTSTQHYSYDATGHMVRQLSTNGSTEYTFDYSCWLH
jgi:YD repeat-containing protein